MTSLMVDNSLVDHISQLPEDILVYILSLLKLKEVGRSSVLSSRWKDLWKFSTRLNFRTPSKSKLLKLKEKNKLDHEILKYVTYVTKVLILHKGTSLEEVTIDFALDASYSKDIDEWIKSVVTKRVKRLVIDLFYHSKEMYHFPEQCFHDLKDPSTLSSFECLTSLSLSYVNVSDEHLEYISKFPHLESLSVSWLKHPLNLKVDGNAVQLKYLDISRCNLQSIDLCAPKLVTFNYYGREVKKIHIGINPLLTKLMLGLSYGDAVVYGLVPFWNHLSQLETLTLHMNMRTNMEIPTVSELRKLKHLILKITCVLEERLAWVTSLIEAAPCLQKFTLTLFWYRPEMPRLPYDYEPLIRHHECLKEVEIFGFVGCSSDFELIAYLWKNALNLEKMVIQTRKLTKQSRERFKEFRKSSPHGLKLIIL